MATSITDSRTICIIIASESDRGDGRLRRVLAERQWQPVMHTEPLAAMAEAAIREGEQVARSEWGLLRTESIVMMISERWADEHADDQAQLIHAMRQYLPGISLWSLDGHDLTPIHVPQSACEPAGAMHSRSEPAHRIDGHLSTSEARASITITREEMDMLLEATEGGER